MKKLVFPDQTEISSEQSFKVIDFTPEQSLVSYKDKEAGEQILWIPNDFVVDK